MSFASSLWSEKYMPLKLEEMVLPDKYRKDFERSIENKEIEHCLFHGPAGSGKCLDGNEEIEVWIEIDD